MKIYIKHLSLLLLLSAMACMAGCSKSPAPSTAAPSIIGTWGIVSEEEKEVVNGVTKIDMTGHYSTDIVVYTFLADGNYVITGTRLIGGPYTYINNVLSIFDTASASTGWERLTVTKLTADSLSFGAAIDSSSSGGMDTVYYTILNCIR
jgi:hypothetical protein